MSIWEDVAQEFACSHEQQDLRFSLASNGARQYRMQCLRCGWLSLFLKKTDARVMASAAPVLVDMDLRANWDQMVRDEVERRQAAEHDSRSSDWWIAYTRYLQSPEWHARRQQVLERDGYLCQACRKQRGTQVHHLTYDHLEHEPLFELVTVCDSCHYELTMLDRQRRAA